MSWSTKIAYVEPELLRTARIGHSESMTSAMPACRRAPLWQADEPITTSPVRNTARRTRDSMPAMLLASRRGLGILETLAAVRVAESRYKAAPCRKCAFQDTPQSFHLSVTIAAAPNNLLKLQKVAVQSGRDVTEVSASPMSKLIICGGLPGMPRIRRCPRLLKCYVLLNYHSLLRFWCSGADPSRSRSLLAYFRQRDDRMQDLRQESSAAGAILRASYVDD